MRLILLTVVLLLGFVPAASGQPASRFELGPVARLDGVFIEGRASGSTAVAGVVTTFRISTTYGVESIAPELRFVYGGPARIGNKHRELGLGARAVWRFK